LRSDAITPLGVELPPPPPIPPTTLPPSCSPATIPLATHQPTHQPTYPSSRPPNSHVSVSQMMPPNFLLTPNIYLSRVSEIILNKLPVVVVQRSIRHAISAITSHNVNRCCCSLSLFSHSFLHFLFIIEQTGEQAGGWRGASPMWMWILGYLSGWELNTLATASPLPL